MRSGEASGITCRSSAAVAARRSGLRHVLDRDDDLEVEVLAYAGVDDLALAPRADEEVRDALQRALGRREPDPLRIVAALAGDEVREPLEGQGEVRAALRLGDRVDLVDDHRLDPGEDLAHLRGDHQVQRLGRGDQDVRRRAAHRLALLLRGVARPQPDRDLGADPLQRRPEVALDVVGEGLERRDVDDLGARAELLGRRASESIPQRNALSVLPEPVGAQISVLAPEAIRGQP